MSKNRKRFTRFGFSCIVILSLTTPSVFALSAKIKRAVEKQKKEYLKPYKSKKRVPASGGALVPKDSNIYLRYSLVEEGSLLGNDDSVEFKIDCSLNTGSASKSVPSHSANLSAADIGTPKVFKVEASKLNTLYPNNKSFAENFDFSVRLNQGSAKSEVKSDRLDYILMASSPADFYYDIKSSNGKKVTVLVEVFYDN